MLVGLPAITDSISYHTTEELFTIRLLSFCPPIAKRPFFQEGYVVGPFPFYRLNDPDRKSQFDFGRRLIAKFEIPNKPGDFFGKGFEIIPRAKLYQEEDKFKKFLDKLEG